MPKMTGVQYEKKVKAYLKNHLDHIVIHRLRTNQPLTATDLLGLERTLAEIGEDDGQTLLTGLLARSEAPRWPTSFGTWWGWIAPRRNAPSPASSPTRASRHRNPLRRDGDRPAHGPRRYGGIGSLRTALQQPARRGAGGIVWRKEKRDRRDFRHTEGGPVGVDGEGSGGSKRHLIQIHPEPVPSVRSAAPSRRTTALRTR